MYFRSAHLFAVVAFGLFGDAATAQEASDMKLEDVGFVMRPANTPQQLERLRLLPPRTFVARSKRWQALLHLRRSRLLPVCFPRR